MKHTELPTIHRPYDWQDKLVIWGSCITGAICLVIVIWWR